MTSRTVTAIFATLVLISTSCSRDPGATKQQFVRSGDQYFADKKYADAIIQYRNAVAIDPQFGEGRAKLARAYQESGDLPGALREYVRAADLLPNDVDVQLHAGGLLLSAGQFPEARARATAVLEKEPKNVTGLVLMGNALAGLKDFDGAVSEIEEAIDADPRVTLTYANLGLLQLAHGSRDAAENAFKRAIQVDPKSVIAHLNLGSFYWAGGDRANAERELKAAYDLDPKGAETTRSLGAFYILGPQPAQGEPYLKAFVEMKPTVSNRLILADFYLSANRNRDAVAVLEALSEEKDGFAPAKLRLSSIDFREGRRPHAYETIEEILKRNPVDEQALEMKARFLINDRKQADALKLADSVIAKYSPALASHYLRGVALESSGRFEEAIEAFQQLLKLSPGAVAPKLELAGLYLTRGDGQTAVQYAAQVIKARPRSPAAYFAHAQALVKLHNYAGAEREFVALSRSFPKSSDVHAWLGMIYEATHDLGRARESYRRALDLQANSRVPEAGLISLDLTEKKNESARARLESIVAAQPNDPAVLLLAGSTYFRLRDFRKAEPAFQKLLEIDPANLEAFDKLGQIYLSENRLDEARKNYEDVARQQARPVAATTMIGLIMSLQNKPDEARKQFQRALDIDPGAAVAANNLAWDYAQNGQNLDVALKLAQAAKSKLPNDSRVSDTLGWIYYQKGLASLAITSLEEAVKQPPANSTIYYHLGLSYLKNGDHQRARDSLQRALKLNPQFKEAEDGRRLLASIG